MTKETKKSTSETKLLYQIMDLELSKPEQEVSFCDDRKWRFDFAWCEIMLAVEVEGGTWSGGRHIRPKGFEADCEKYNRAAIDGWCVIRVTTTMINNGSAIKTILAAYDKGMETLLDVL